MNMPTVYPDVLACLGRPLTDDERTTLALATTTATRMGLCLSIPAAMTELGQAIFDSLKTLPDGRITPPPVLYVGTWLHFAAGGCYKDADEATAYRRLWAQHILDQDAALKDKP